MKTSGLSALISLTIGREILRADRIALVVGELEFGVGERRPRRARQVDAETVGDADHRDGVADLLFIAQLGEQFDQRLGGIGAGAEQPETVGPALCQFRRAVGDGGRSQVRIAFAVERRPDRQVEAGAPRRQDEIDLVLVDQPLQCAHGLFGVGAVVVLHDLDRDALVAELDAAGGVHFLHPQFVVGDRGDGCAAGVRAGARNRVADLDRALGFGNGGKAEGGGAGGGYQQRGAPRQKCRHVFLPDVLGPAPLAGAHDCLTLGEVTGGLELDVTGEVLYFSGNRACSRAADCLRRRRDGGIARVEWIAGRRRARGPRRAVFGRSGGAIMVDPPEGRAAGASVAAAVGSRPGLMAGDRNRARGADAALAAGERRCRGRSERRRAGISACRWTTTS